MLRNRTKEQQQEILALTKQLFLLRFSDSDVVVEHVHQPKDVIESWSDCMLIADNLLAMFWDACQ